MRKQNGFAVLAAAALAVAAFGQSGGSSAQQHSHGITRPADLKWAALPLPGCDLASVAGDMTKAGEMFTIRIRCNDGVRVPAHWHVTDEHVTVIRGVFQVGMGEKFDAAQLTSMNAGDYAVIPANMRHFALNKGETLLQIHGMGPFVINWVNPADVPTAPPAAKK